VPLTLKNLESELASHKDYKDLDQKEWEEKIEYRAITKRSQKDFDYLIPMYVRKIGWIREQLRETGIDIKVVPQLSDGRMKSTAEIVDEMNSQLDEINMLTAKEERLFDKLAVCLKEVELRKNNLVTRTDLHDATLIYIDYDNGNDENDGETTGNSIKTITEYTTTQVRTPGDIGYLRAGITWDQGTETKDISFDESGTLDNYIKIIGCDAVTNDPWGDADDTKPIIDFEDAAYQVNLIGDSYWWLENLDIKQGNDGYGNVYSYSGWFNYLKNCVVSDSPQIGIRIDNSIMTVDSCEMYDLSNGGGQIYIQTDSYMLMKSCILNAGAGLGSIYGVYVKGKADIIDTSFGITTQFAALGIYFYENCSIHLRNCPYTGTMYSTTFKKGMKVSSEDEDGVYGGQKTLTYEGTITKETADPRSGGATSYAKMLPNAYCGPCKPLVLGNDLSGFSAVWLTKDVEKTITVYARTGSAWDSALAAGEAFLTASYLSNGATATRTEVSSAEQITNDAEWTAFTVTITPLQTGFVYLWFILAEYEDTTEYIDVDILPVVT